MYGVVLSFTNFVSESNVLYKGVLDLSGLVITVRAGLSCGVIALCVGHTFFLNRICVHISIVQNLYL